MGREGKEKGKGEMEGQGVGDNRCMRASYGVCRLPCQKTLTHLSP